MHHCIKVVAEHAYTMLTQHLPKRGYAQQGWLEVLQRYFCNLPMRRLVKVSMKIKWF